MTGRTQYVQPAPVAMTEEQWRAAQRARYISAQRRTLVNAVLIGAMIAAAIYAPAASYPQLADWISHALANLLAKRGVDWQAAWHQASLLMMGN